MTGWIVFGVVVIVIILIIGYFIGVYNNLVSLKNNVAKAFANIDVLLKQRHDELPKLVDACKEYMGYEKDTLSKLTDARTQVESARASGDVKKLGAAETMMRQSMGNLFAVAENYPDLKANNSFQQLQKRISDLESSISDRREFFNESVNVYNVGIEQFPSNIIAGMFHYTEKQLLEFSDAEKADVNIDNLFKS